MKAVGLPILYILLGVTGCQGVESQADAQQSAVLREVRQELETFCRL